MAIRHAEVFPVGASPDSISWEQWNADHIGAGGDADFSAVAEDILPATDDTFDIGSLTERWAEGHFSDFTRVAGAQATGTLTLPVQVTAGDTFQIGSLEYTFVASGASVPGEINVGANLAATQANIVAAVNATDGWNETNYQAWISAFVANVATVTAGAVRSGTAGNVVVTTETFTSGSNVFSAVTLLGGTDSYQAIGVDPQWQIHSDGRLLLVATQPNATRVDIAMSDGAGLGGHFILNDFDGLSRIHDEYNEGSTSRQMNGPEGAGYQVNIQGDGGEIYARTGDAVERFGFRWTLAKTEWGWKTPAGVGFMSLYWEAGVLDLRVLDLPATDPAAASQIFTMDAAGVAAALAAGARYLLISDGP